MREFLGAQSSVQRQKAQLVNFKGLQLKKELCQFTIGYFSTVPKTHGASFVVWFGFTGMEHLNFNSLSKPPFQGVFV